MSANGNGPEPPADCPLCPRLAGFRAENRDRFPGYFNNPVPTLGSPDARLLIVGLAPGLHGANRTGRPFTGDFAGDLLYATLLKHGLARGEYFREGNDNLELRDCAITNAVRCVPPANKPLPAEIATCRSFLVSLLATMRDLRSILALGRIAHVSVVNALAASQRHNTFRHGGQYSLGQLTLISSYHCSRYNTNTGVLTAKMFDEVVKRAKLAAMPQI
ncbi:MAG: uracil-DNA glycosylase [Alphaproteobacteria bacterium]|nr:uracil-DNA glycosylase [Alphaproteobacteria bacterium]